MAVNKFGVEFESFMDTFVEYFENVGVLGHTFPTSVHRDGKS